MSVDFFFPHNMLGNIELNVDTTNNHPAQTTYFTNTSLCAPIFKGTNDKALAKMLFWCVVLCTQSLILYVLNSKIIFFYIYL